LIKTAQQSKKAKKVITQKLTGKAQTQTDKNEKKGKISPKTQKQISKNEKRVTPF